MALRSRSRSKTPFQSESLVQTELSTGGNHIAVTRASSKRLAATKITTSITEESSEIKTSQKRKSNNKGFFYKTSDYSSGEEGSESETITHLSESERRTLVKDAKAAANGGAEVSALGLYRQAGRYWDKYPKTDYTYSPHSRDRVELAPGVVQMPNMSRKTIHSATNTDRYEYRSNVNRNLFNYSSNSSNNNVYQDEYDSGAEETNGSFKIIRTSTKSTRTVKTVLYSFYSAVLLCFYTVYRVQSQGAVWVAKKIHHVASWLMLMDTWLLQKRRRTDSKMKAVLLLCFVPLLLFGGWWLLANVGSAIYEWRNNATAPPLVDIRQQPPQSIDVDAILERLLHKPEFQALLTNRNDHNDNDAILSSIEHLRDELNTVKSEVNNPQKYDDLRRLMWNIRAESVRNYAKLNQRLAKCCNRFINVEPYIVKILNDPLFLSKQTGLVDWLHSLFTAKQVLEEKLSNLIEHHREIDDMLIKHSADLVMERVVPQLTSGGDNLSDDRIRNIVRAALKVYDADKTGLVDYAMEPMGAQVVSTRCTEMYRYGTAVLSVLGIPIWYPTKNSPRTVITPGLNPGECWAFENFPGFLVIRLANRIKIDAFSVEHISRLLVPEGRIDSAPKSFEVWGLNEEFDKQPVLIGDYVYDYDGESIQFFAAHQHGLIFSMVELRIKSNHGNPNYTCLYRFRVHGKIVHEPSS